MMWTSPLQLTICLAIFLVNFGPSALAGFVFFLVAMPLQGWAMKSLFKVRRNAMEWTDKRVQLLQELLSGMKVLKLFG
jgi:ABC-type siderophore export system fused ATPase/permease subunit